MTSPHASLPLDEGLLDLLVKQVTEGLSYDEERTLKTLDSTLADAYLGDLERAAAAISLAGPLRTAEVPSATLRARIERQAFEFLDGNRARGRSGPSAFELESRTAQPKLRHGAAGWWAAAACLMLAVGAWLRAPIPVHSVTQQRAALLTQPGSISLNLGATQDPAAAGVTGDVAWNPATQRGFLRLVGLKPNDPRVHQYQAWIFDSTRDKRYPVDAGIFDVAAGGSEIIVPIHGSLPIRSAKAFAVTVEKPGGVVVSALEHVVLLGAAG